MKKYKVIRSYKIWEQTIVEADSKKQAIELVKTGTEEVNLTDIGSSKWEVTVEE